MVHVKGGTVGSTAVGSTAGVREANGREAVETGDTLDKGNTEAAGLVDLDVAAGVNEET